MIAFAKELKQINGKEEGVNTIHIYYFPSINNNTESAVICFGHHTR